MYGAIKKPIHHHVTLAMNTLSLSLSLTHTHTLTHSHTHSHTRARAHTSLLAYLWARSPPVHAPRRQCAVLIPVDHERSPAARKLGHLPPRDIYIIYPILFIYSFHLRSGVLKIPRYIKYIKTRFIKSSYSGSKRDKWNRVTSEEKATLFHVVVGVKLM